MRICSAQTQIKIQSQNNGNLKKAFTLSEVVVVLVLVSLMLLFAGTNLYGLLAKNTFKGQLQEIVSSMQMAAYSAAETGRKYEMIFDLANQRYLLRQITTPDLSQVLEEEIIISNDLSENCLITYVIFDDGDYTNDSTGAQFRVGPAGWQYGGKIVFMDSNERTYSVLVNRLNRNIEIKDGDVNMMLPKNPEEVGF